MSFTPTNLKKRLTPNPLVSPSAGPPSAYLELVRASTWLTGVPNLLPQAISQDSYSVGQLRQWFSESKPKQRALAYIGMHYAHACTSLECLECGILFGGRSTDMPGSLPEGVGAVQVVFSDRLPGSWKIQARDLLFFFSPSSRQQKSQTASGKQQFYRQLAREPSQALVDVMRCHLLPAVFGCCNQHKSEL